MTEEQIVERLAQGLADIYGCDVALRAEVDRLRDALRLIELLGYREGENFGWLNAHMRGTATAALEGQDLSPYWRLFPHHRPALTSTEPQP